MSAVWNMWKLPIIAYNTFSAFQECGIWCLQWIENASRTWDMQLLYVHCTAHTHTLKMVLDDFRVLLRWHLIFVCREIKHAFVSYIYVAVPFRETGTNCLYFTSFFFGRIYEIPVKTLYNTNVLFLRKLWHSRCSLVSLCTNIKVKHGFEHTCHNNVTLFLWLGSNWNIFLVIMPASSKMSAFNEKIKSIRTKLWRKHVYHLICVEQLEAENNTYCICVRVRLLTRVILKEWWACGKTWNMFLLWASQKSMPHKKPAVISFAF